MDKLLNVNELKYFTHCNSCEATLLIKVTEDGKCSCCSGETHSITVNTPKGLVRRGDLIAMLEALAKRLRTNEDN